MRVVIVDDEHLVRLGIQSYLDGANRPFEIAGVYADGGSALTALRGEHAAGRTVGLLITDIRMPVMSGIELTEHCRSEGLAQFVVVLSCHDEFELVRQAFTRGADEYVLKHEVEQDQLVTVLDRVTEGLLGSLARVSRASDSHSSDSQGADRLGALDASLPAIVAAYRFCHQYTDSACVIPWQPDTLALDTEITTALEAFAPAVHVPGDRGGVIVMGLRAADEVVPERRARKACEAVLQRVRRYWNREMQFWITPQPCTIEALQESPGSRELHAVWEWGIYHPGDAVISGPEPREHRVEDLQVPYLHLGERDIPKVWNTAIAAFLEIAKERDVPASHLFLSISGILHQLDRDLVQTVGRTLHDVVHQHDADAGETGSLVQQLERIDRVSELLTWLGIILDRVCDALLQSARRTSQVGRVLQYLDNTYREPLNLEALAERFSISKAYLCSRVRTDTGLTLSQHINRRRISRARELLRASSMSAKEVCFEVGYDNPNYFSRVFKAVTGESVTDFRNAVNDQRNTVRGAESNPPLP